MDNKIVIVGNEATPFARYIKRLGMDVYVARRSRSGVEVTETEDCEAIYWDMETIVRPRMRALARSLLLSVPKECVKILDFNLKEIDEERLRLVRLSLECCDLMKIDQREFSVLCDMLGLTSPHAFDNEFDLIGQFAIKTLILTHGSQGCHVFHGNAVSEKWGFEGMRVISCQPPIVDRQAFQPEEAEGAFLASFYAASRLPGRRLAECHRIVGRRGHAPHRTRLFQKP